MTRGAIVGLEQLWRLAIAWYADRLDESFRRKSVSETEATFAAVGLTGAFWRLT